MKKLIFILCNFTICNLSIAQICNERFDFNNKAESGFSVQQNDSGFVMCGVRKDSLNYPMIALVFYDTLCNVRYTKSYGKYYNQYYAGIGGSMIKTYDNGFALGGNIKDSLNNVSALLMKFYSNGDTAWTKLYGDGTNEWIAYQVKQTPDSGYILVGVKSGSNEDAFLIKTDSLGNEQWRNTYGTSATEYGFTVICTSDGGYLIGGFWCQSCQTDDGALSVFKINSSGTLVWQKQFGNPLRHEGGATVGHEFSDGSFLVGGYYSYTSGNKMNVYKIAANGNLVWRKDISGNGSLNTTITSMKSINDSTVLIGGFIPDNFSLTGVLAKVDQNGNINMKRHFDLTLNNLDAFNDVIQCSDGTYAMAGTVGAPQDMWFVHTDEYGCLQPDCWKNDPYNDGLELSEPLNVGIDELGDESGILLYPNPASNMVNVELNEPAKAYQIFNANGKLVTSETIQSDRFVITTNDWPNGLYFILINSDSGYFYKKFVVLKN